MKFDEKSGRTSVFRANANYANGNTRDRQGRLGTCEHSVTRRVTRTGNNGKITVLADSFEGKRLNAPNDIVVKSDDSIWFTDPLFGINGEWEGSRAKPEQATTNVYRIDKSGKITALITDLVNPNGLAFSPDEKKLYVVEWKGTPNRSIWAYDVGADGTVTSKTKFYDAADFGALDGFRVDRDADGMSRQQQIGRRCVMGAGIHHITLITRKLQANVDFYVGFLGLRLVKQTGVAEVLQDAYYTEREGPVVLPVRAGICIRMAALCGVVRKTSATPDDGPTINFRD